MAKQAARLAYASSMNFTTVPAVQLAEMIAELTPGDLNRVFFSSGGSEAVETAIKIAKQVQAMRGFPRRYKIIARRGSYHGMTYGAMSLTALQNEHHFGPFMYGVSHVPHPEPLPLRLRRRGRAGGHHGRQGRRAGDRVPGTGDGRGGDRRADLDRGRRPRAVARSTGRCCARSATSTASC